MADLRFTRERSQLRGLGILIALVLALVGGFAQGLVGIIVLGTGALVCLYAFTAYLLAVTECTPAGIRTRGLAGPRRCSWSQVTDISLRYGRRSVRITVTLRTADGSASVRPFMAESSVIQDLRQVFEDPGLLALNVIRAGTKLVP